MKIKKTIAIALMLVMCLGLFTMTGCSVDSKKSNTKNNSAIDVIVIIIKYLLKQKKYVNLKYFCNDKMYVYKNNIK